MSKVIIYCRKSEKPKDRRERQEEKAILSLESQESELVKFAQERGLTVVRLFKENESAYRPGRAMFDEMVGMLERGEADSILVFNINRVARNAVDGGRIIYFLDQGILEAIMTPEKTYRNVTNDKFVLQIEFAMAKKNSDDNYDFVKSNIAKKAQNGEFPGKARLGYVNIDKEGKIAGRQFDLQKQTMLQELNRPLKRIEIDPILGPLVTELCIQAARGTHTQRELCTMAERMGLRAGRSKKKLTPSTLVCMLRDTFYCGSYYWDGKLYTENVKHDPLITRELFERIQKVLDRKSFIKKERYEYLFSSRIVCGECGSTVAGQTQKGHRYYSCTGWRALRQGIQCSQKTYLREDRAEKQVNDLLKTFDIPSEFVDWSLDILRSASKEEAALRQSVSITTQKQKEEAERRLCNLLDLKLSDGNRSGQLLSDEEFLKEKIKIKTEIEQANKAVNEASKNIVNWVDECAKFFDFSMRLRRKYVDSDPIEKREILGEIGHLVMNRGELAFQPEFPYAFAADIQKKLLPEPVSYEPGKGVAGSAKRPSFDHEDTKWRDGRDSNPRPRQ